MQSGMSINIWGVIDRMGGWNSVLFQHSKRPTSLFSEINTVNLIFGTKKIMQTVFDG